MPYDFCHFLLEMPSANPASNAGWRRERMSALGAGERRPENPTSPFVKPVPPVVPTAGTLAGLDRFAVALGEAAQGMLVNVLKVTREQLVARGFSRVLRADQAHAWAEQQGANVEVSCLVSDRDNEVAFTVLVLLHVYPGMAATLLPMTRTQVSLNIGRAGLMPLDGPEDAKGIARCVLADTFLTEDAIVDTDAPRYLERAFARLGAGQAEDALRVLCAETVATLVRDFEP